MVPEQNNKAWNPGTWILLMSILLAGSFVSFYLKNFTDSLLLYLPTSIAIVMVHWFGLRILPLAFINALFTLYLWDAPGDWYRIFILATREPVVVFSSWFFCNGLVNKNNGLYPTSVFGRFVLFGILLPDIINSLYSYHYSFIGGDLEKVTLLWLSDFITVFSISVPLIHLFKPMKTKYFFKLRPIKVYKFSNKPVIELFIITLIFLILGFIVSFDKYWFIYGISAMFIAVRHGFNYVILINSIIFILNYILPLLNLGDLVHGFSRSTQHLNVHLGMSTMLLGTTLIGRVISDLKEREDELNWQKQQIEEANLKLRKSNSEMDRFVYSVSHDISAPLKSIRGLIAIGQLENTEVKEFPYLSKIEQSVRKLEVFTEEILAHSKASRKELKKEDINIQELVDDIIDNLKYLDGFGSIKFTYQFDYPIISTDRFLLKVVMSNLISNAIKFQKKRNGHKSEVSIKSYLNKDLFIEVKDNGVGINQEYRDRVFEMFYRASVDSSGSGLGLFISKEAVEKLNGELSFESKNNEGTLFTIRLPQN